VIFAEKPVAALADICGSVAGNKARQSHVVFYGVKRRLSEKEALLPTKRIFWDCCRNTGHFLRGVERVKRL